MAGDHRDRGAVGHALREAGREITRVDEADVHERLGADIEHAVRGDHPGGEGDRGAPDDPIDFGPDVTQQLAEREAWAGGNLNIAAFTVPPHQAVKAFSTALSVKEFHLTQIHGKPYYLAYEDDHRTGLLAADDSLATAFERFPAGPLVVKVRTFYPKADILEATQLDIYDDYYYSRKKEKRLPVLRIKLDTPEQPWYYIDLKTGQIVLKREQGSRLERWLYHGLHSLDFGFLIYRRPLWDIVVGILMLGGTLVSITGLVLTWKWIRRKTDINR